MSCLITTGIAKGCRDNVGGIKKVLITNTSNVTAFTPIQDIIGTPSDDGLITGITMNSSAKFYEFIPNKNSSNWTETIQSNLQNGTLGFDQALVMMFAKNEASKRNQIKLMGQATMYAIVLDYNEKYWLLGEKNGLELTAGTSGSGTGPADMNGWNITLSGSEHHPAREVEASIIAAITAA